VIYFIFFNLYIYNFADYLICSFIKIIFHYELIIFLTYDYYDIFILVLISHSVTLNQLFRYLIFLYISIKNNTIVDIKNKDNKCVNGIDTV